MKPLSTNVFGSVCNLFCLLSEDFTCPTGPVESLDAIPGPQEEVADDKALIYDSLVPVSGARRRENPSQQWPCGRLQDFEGDVDDSISGWVITPALNSAPSALCLSLAIGEVRTKAVCISVLLCPTSLQGLCSIPCGSALMAFVSRVKVFGDCDKAVVFHSRISLGNSPLCLGAISVTLCRTCLLLNFFGGSHAGNVASTWNSLEFRVAVEY